MRSLKTFVTCLCLVFSQFALTGEIQQRKPMESLGGKGAYQAFYKKMRDSLDMHIKEYNDKRVNKELVLQYFHKDDRSDLLKLIQQHKIKEFPAIQNNDGEYIYKIDENNWVTFTLQDIHKYQVKINDKVVNFKELKRLEGMLNATKNALTHKSSIFYLNQLLGFPEADALPVILFAGPVLATVAVGVASHFVSNSFEPDFEEAMTLGQNYKRVKEIAKLCRANKEGLLANLNQGVTEENSLIHHLLWRTHDWGYDEEELIEAMSGDYADDCTEFSEKILAGAASKNDRTLDGRNWTAKRKKILENFDCGHVPLNVGAGSGYHKKKPAVLDCLKKSCDNVIADHEGCLKDLHGKIDKSTRKSNGEKAIRWHGERWNQKINRRSLGID